MKILEIDKNDIHFENWDHDAIEQYSAKNSEEDKSPNSQFEIVENIEYSEFFTRFLLRNVPCVLSESFTKNWPCRQDWTKIDKDGSNQKAPDLEFFVNIVPKSLHVPVSDCSSREFNAHCSQDMKFSEYHNYWNQTPRNECKYLKDWHFQRDTKDMYTAYQVPDFFSSDWLNEWWEGRKGGENDYKFVYIGPEGSWTPLHSDVFSSYSWSANIVGIKKWIFLPPGEEKKLTDKLGNLVFDLQSPEARELELRNGEVVKIVLTQRTGDVVFVPSGWFHQVHNLEDTISINHNWFNGCNIKKVVSQLIIEFRKVQKELEDCRIQSELSDWNLLCQDLLKKSYGMNLHDIMDLLYFIFKKRQQALKTYSQSEKVSDVEFGRNHLQFDMKRIKAVIKSYLHDVVTELKMEKEITMSVEMMQTFDDDCET